MVNEAPIALRTQARSLADYVNYHTDDEYCDDCERYMRDALIDTFPKFVDSSWRFATGDYHPDFEAKVYYVDEDTWIDIVDMWSEAND